MRVLFWLTIKPYSDRLKLTIYLMDFLMKNLEIVTLALSSTLLFGCGGGGGSAPEVKIATKIAVDNDYTFPTNINPWFAGFLSNTDGTETLILSTMDQHKATEFTPPTPILAINVIGNTVVNDTSKLFADIPSYYFTRSVRTFNHPKTKTPAIWFCNTGREVDEAKAIPRVNGKWGEQDGLYVMENGKFVNHTHTLPQIVDFSHGCDVSVNGNETLLIKNTLSWLNSQEQQYAYKFIDDKWVSELPYQSLGFVNNNNIITNSTNPFFATSIKMQGSNAFMFGNGLVKKTNDSYSLSVLPKTDLDINGYSHVQGSFTGDLNNDGHDDLVFIKSSDGIKIKPFLIGTKVEIWFNDGNGNFTYKENSILGFYDEDNFSLDLRFIDINFDGYLDIVSFGQRYVNPCQPSPSCHYKPIDKVLINNGNNTFTVRTINDEALNQQCIGKCNISLWFLKQGKNSFSMVSHTVSNDLNVHKLIAKTYTKESPLPLR